LLHGVQQQKDGNIWKTKLMSLKQTEQNIKDPYRGISEINKSSQPRMNLVQDQNSDLPDYHSSLNK